MRWHLSCIHASGLIDFVDVPLIQVNHEDNVVSETTDSVHGRHCDDEAEEVIYDCVQETVEQGFARHVLHTFELVVDVQLGCHVDKSESVDAAD